MDSRPLLGKRVVTRARSFSLLLVLLSLCVFVVLIFAGRLAWFARWQGLKGEEKASVLSNPCRKGPVDLKTYPFCDMRLSLESRAKHLVERLSLEEKVGLLGNSAKELKSVGVSAYQWWSEALHGVADSPGVTFKGKLTSATSFPQVLTTSSSFNRSLFAQIGNAVSSEARAFANYGQAGLTYWAPNINIFRDPRWGRGHETPGEDPVLNGDYAEAFVRGFQNGNEDPTRLKASACCKHFAAYSLEFWHGYDRLQFNAVVTERDMHESFLPAFEACVVRGKATSIMCSYNAINGVPSCMNERLLKKLARQTWNFDGYITGDCGAVQFTYERYKYHNDTPEEIVRDTLSASVDVACDAFLQQHTEASVRTGVTDIALVDQALINLFKVQLRLGIFDPEDQQPFLTFGSDYVNTPEHHQLALEAARQGMVLLKNEHNTLPWNGVGKKSVAVIGPHGDSDKDFLANYFGVPPFVVTILQAASKYFSHAKYLQGCSMRGDAEESLLLQAEDAARVADQVILAVGLNQKDETEGHDRDSIEFPGAQAELIRRVAKAAREAGKPRVVVVVVAGGAIDLSSQLADDHVGAILWAGYPGMFGGQAILETLVGENNPSGRVTQTFYPAEFARQVDFSDMSMHPNRAKGFPGRTHRFYEGRVVLPFGFGLSYSRFQYQVVESSSLGGIGQDIVVEIKNVGNRRGAHVMLAFLLPPARAVQEQRHGDLQRKLLTYVRTEELSPGESVRARLYVNKTQDLTVFLHPHDSSATMLDLSGKSNSQQSRQEDSWHLQLYGAEDDLVVQL